MFVAPGKSKSRFFSKGSFVSWSHDIDIYQWPDKMHYAHNIIWEEGAEKARSITLFDIFKVKEMIHKRVIY